MAIYLDSARIKEARQAQDLGWVFGVTTNPTLLAKAGTAPEAVLEGLAGLGFHQVCYQLISQDAAAGKSSHWESNRNTGSQFEAHERGDGCPSGWGATYYRPMDLLTLLSKHALSLQTIDHFNAEGVGIQSITRS